MKPPPPTKRTSSDIGFQQYEIRITAKLFIGSIFLLLFIVRLCTTLFDPSFIPLSRLLMRLSLASSASIVILIILEFFLFKKKGSAMIKYSKMFDLILLSLFLADWIDALISGLYRIQQTDPSSFKASSLFIFTAFSWKTLILTLIVQKWYWRMIGPVVVTCLSTGFTIYYDPGSTIFLVAKGLLQLVALFVIFYCEDKTKWKLIWTNLQQLKWMEINNFILNNIPENIMILDFAGERKFVSDHCKDFMKKCQLSLDDFRGLFGRIQDLQRQYESKNNLYMERLTTGNGLLSDLEEQESSSMKLGTLEDLIISFPSLVQEKNLQEREFFVYNGKLKNENVQEKSIEIKISFMQNSDKDYIILILRDTTQRDLLVTLEETNKYKDQLLASVSHELRAPLNGNINLVECAINSPKIPELIKETLLIPALQSSKVLLHIINDIIDMSQIKQKKLRLEIGPGDPKETITSTAQLIELQAKKKGIDFQVELDHNLPNNFYTDHIRLSQITLNLLSNAIKFTTKGIVKLIVTRVLETNWIRVSIEDSGIGISPENLSKLSQNKTWTQLEGDLMGLGLSITSSLVELLAPKDHQNITVKSVPNQGSIFSFLLENKIETPQDNSSSWEVAEEYAKSIEPTHFSKLQTFENSSTIPLIAEPEVQKCSCPRILIVDDNPFNIMALETILSSLEIPCESVYSGFAAIQKLLNVRKSNSCYCKECKALSILFMDQEMPEMSGADTVREIKRLQRENMISSNIKFIGCTAHKAKEEVDKFFAAGLDNCIFKPVSIALIKETLKGSLL